MLTSDSDGKDEDVMEDNESDTQASTFDVETVFAVQSDTEIFVQSTFYPPATDARD